MTNSTPGAVNIHDTTGTHDIKGIYPPPKKKIAYVRQKQLKEPPVAKEGEFEKQNKY